MRLIILAAVTMILFAANSLLCRLALVRAGMDAASFTLLRVVSGALFLWLLLLLRPGKGKGPGGSFKAAAALFGYMLGFSLAYRGLPAATGNLILVVAILLASLAAGRALGEPFGKRQLAGAATSLAGLLVLLGPGLARPSLLDALLMGAAGASWVVYTVLGRDSADPAGDTRGNFIRCLPLALLLLPFASSMPLEGVLLAVASGAAASGAGYVLWYRLVARLTSFSTALVQLSVPVLTALCAWPLLGEKVSLRLILSGSLILCGVACTRTRPEKSELRQTD